MMKTMLMAVAMVCAVAAPSYGQAVDIAGKWDVSITSPQGPMSPAPLELKKDGDKYVGTFATQQGTADVEATVKDKAVTIFLPPFQTQNGPVNLSMTGTVDGDTMKGTIDVGGGLATLDWTARRSGPAPAPAPAPAAAEAQPASDISGTWGLEVTSAGGSGTPTVVLKQEGEKLSGQYTGQFGEAPLTGTIKGNAFTFSVSVTVQGTTATIIYTGTVEKDTMKGTVTLAEMGEGTFTGKKK